MVRIGLSGFWNLTGADNRKWIAEHACMDWNVLIHKIQVNVIQRPFSRNNLLTGRRPRYKSA